jgi:gamma-glutamylcyclotransferase (GGCT)/AIG2-like uncharacterized protein YtfP
MYYFAYGSNMNFELMRRICGRHFTVVGAVTLKDYHLSPDLRGYVNIKKSLGSKVLGVLYEFDQEAMDALDEFEGYPHVFNREYVKVFDFQDRAYEAWVYVETEDQFGGDFVREEYLNRVIIGATENHLPEEWINYLKSLNNNIPSI